MLLVSAGPVTCASARVVGLERSIRFERHPRRDDARIGEQRVVFVELDLARQPDHRRIAQRLIDAIEVDVVAFLAWKLDVHDRLERHADEQLEVLPLRLDERLHGDVARDVVRRHPRHARRRDDQEQGGDTCRPLHAHGFTSWSSVPGQITPWFGLVTGPIPL